MRNRLAPWIGAILLVIVNLISATPAAAGAYPRVMAATGDSITRAFDSTWLHPLQDNPAASWSSGSDSRVNSHYLRLRAATPSGKLTAYNDARSGAKMNELSAQMSSAVSQKATYVTVLMGANDVCTSSESTMTSVAEFTAQFTAGMDTIISGTPNVLVYVVSIPDVYRLWEVYHDSFVARSVWSSFSICQSMLANPDSTAQADVDRRARVRQRNIDFNAVLADVCAHYKQCRFDGNAVFNTAFSGADVSTIDYFHPSITGQAHLASVTWAAGYWGG